MSCLNHGNLFYEASVNRVTTPKPLPKTIILVGNPPIGSRIGVLAFLIHVYFRWVILDLPSWVLHIYIFLSTTICIAAISSSWLVVPFSNGFSVQLLKSLFLLAHCARFFGLIVGRQGEIDQTKKTRLVGGGWAKRSEEPAFRWGSQGVEFRIAVVHVLVDGCRGKRQTKENKSSKGKKKNMTGSGRKQQKPAKQKKQRSKWNEQKKIKTKQSDQNWPSHFRIPCVHHLWTYHNISRPSGTWF